MKKRYCIKNVVIVIEGDMGTHEPIAFLDGLQWTSLQGHSITIDTDDAEIHRIKDTQ